MSKMSAHCCEYPSCEIHYIDWLQPSSSALDSRRPSYPPDSHDLRENIPTANYEADDEFQYNIDLIGLSNKSKTRQLYASWREIFSTFSL